MEAIYAQILFSMSFRVSHSQCRKMSAGEMAPNKGELIKWQNNGLIWHQWDAGIKIDMTRKLVNLGRSSFAQKTEWRRMECEIRADAAQFSSIVCSVLTDIFRSSWFIDLAHWPMQFSGWFIIVAALCWHRMRDTQIQSGINEIINEKLKDKRIKVKIVWRREIMLLSIG